MTNINSLTFFKMPSCEEFIKPTQKKDTTVPIGQSEPNKIQTNEPFTQAIDKQLDQNELVNVNKPKIPQDAKRFMTEDGIVYTQTGLTKTPDPGKEGNFLYVKTYTAINDPTKICTIKNDEAMNTPEGNNDTIKQMHRQIKFETILPKEE